MSIRSEIATTRFLSGYNCAQAVLDAFRDETGLDDDLALKIATGLGAGMGRKQEVCGAVTGGILVLGLRHGRGTTADRSATEQTYLAQIIKEAHTRGCYLELDSQPERLDLTDVYCQTAREAGVLVSINSDSHSHERLCPAGRRY